MNSCWTGVVHKVCPILWSSLGLLHVLCWWQGALGSTCSPVVNFVIFAGFCCSHSPMCSALCGGFRICRASQLSLHGGCPMLALYPGLGLRLWLFPVLCSEVWCLPFSLLVHTWQIANQCTITSHYTNTQWVQGLNMLDPTLWNFPTFIARTGYGWRLRLWGDSGFHLSDVYLLLCRSKVWRFLIALVSVYMSVFYYQVLPF